MHDISLLKRAVERIKLDQEKYFIRENDIYWSSTMMVVEGKEWIWDLVGEYAAKIVGEERDSKIGAIIETI